MLLFAEKQTLHEPPKAEENEGEEEGEREARGPCYSLALFGLLEGVSGANTAVLTPSTYECTC